MCDASLQHLLQAMVSFSFHRQESALNTEPQIGVDLHQQLDPDSKWKSLAWLAFFGLAGSLSGKAPNVIGRAEYGVV